MSTSLANPGLLTAIAIALVPIYLIYRWVQPPSYLKNVPGLSVMTVLKGLFTKKGFSLTLLDNLLPVLEEHKMAKVYFGGMWVVILSDPEDCKKICSQTEVFPKFQIFGDDENHFFLKFLGVSVVNTNGDEWKNHRKVANPAFRRPWPTELFAESVYNLFDAIDKDIGQTQDAHDLMQRMTLDVLGQGLFDYDFKALKHHDGQGFKLYKELMKGLFDPTVAFFPILTKFPIPKIKRLMAHMEEFNTLLYSILEDKKREYQEKLANDTFNERSADLLTLMIKATYEDQHLTDDELRSNLLVFFIAGHDTTANSLSSILCYLALYPKYQEKAREEARSILGDDPRVYPTFEQQARELPFINAIIKEAMRLVPPLPSLGIRENTKPVELRGKLFPTGTKFAPHVYSMQRSKSYWSDPEVFRPERFLHEENLTPNSWLAFGSGSRQCIGMNFSLMEQRVSLSMLLRRYSWSLPEDSVHTNRILKISSRGLLAPETSELRFEHLT